MKSLIVILLLFSFNSQAEEHLGLVSGLLDPLKSDDAVEKFKEKTEDVEFGYNKYHIEAAAAAGKEIPSVEEFKNSLLTNLRDNGSISEYKVVNEESRLNGAQKRVRVQVVFSNGTTKSINMELLRTYKGAKYKIMKSNFSN